MLRRSFLATLCSALLVIISAHSGLGQDSLRAIVGDYQAVDTLAIVADASADAQACLGGLGWMPHDFQVHVELQPQAPEIVTVQFPSPKPSDNAQVDVVNCDWYVVVDADTQRPLVRPAVVVVHESGSDMTVGRIIASELRRRGLHAFLVQLPGYGRRKSAEFSSADITRVFAQGVADVRRARDAVAVLPNIDASHIAVQGTSLGGFVATLASSLDGKFESAFLLLCGGDLYGVLTSGNRDARKTLERLQATGLSDQQLRLALNSIEPLRIAHRLQPGKTWLFSASFDQVVLPKHARLLAETAHLSADHHIQMLATHYSGIIFLPAVMSKIEQVVLQK